MEATEMARDNLEEAHRKGEPNARRVAVLVAILAAALAVSEMGEKMSQNAYLAHHIQAADHWAFLQARNIRSTVESATASLLESQPNAADPAVRQRIDAARAEATRLRDDPSGTGSKQIEAMARAEERDREIAFHKYHFYEIAVGALQIGIVLASVSVVTRVRWLALAAAGIGAVAAVLAFINAVGLI
jgi:hypothetical protein